ncbi:MAG: SDR family NAD(P)-dependent oxidoreductase [Nitriliruptorales bacterium]|nr:SDR family NAD(P)-dependent oxidoreductase [Nitriliruptorales bacterium]
MDLAGSTSLITGGASGLGWATAQRLHADGANVALLDLPTSAGAERAAELDRALFTPADVTDADSVAAAIAATTEEFGALDVLVNCAGLDLPQRVVNREGEPANLDAFSTVIGINLIGTFNVIRLAVPAMLERDVPDGEDRGVIVNTASIAAFDGQIGQAAYSASKGGIVGMTLPIARDLAAKGIRVCTIAPGLMDTPLLAMLPEEKRAALSAGVPHPPRLGAPAEFASLVAEIVTNGYFNGETIRLDGSLRMAPR